MAAAAGPAFPLDRAVNVSTRLGRSAPSQVDEPGIKLGLRGIPYCTRCATFSPNVPASRLSKSAAPRRGTDADIRRSRDGTIEFDRNDVAGIEGNTGSQ